MLVDLPPPTGPGGQPRPGHGGEPRARDLAAAHLVDLMMRTAQGHEGAFTELYGLTRGRVYGIALKVLRSPEHAQEVAQEVYTEVWRQAKKYAPDKGSVVGWIVTMTHRRAVDRVRSVSSEVARDEKYAFPDLDHEGDEVWDSVAQQYDIQRVREAMATLTPIQRQALQLAYFDGLTQSQISQLLNLPLGTVKTRMRDGLRRLGETLGGGNS